MEDLLEEIVGDIFDEHDTPEIRLQEKGVALIDGATPLDDFNAEHGTSLDDREYTTLGGFLFGQLGHLPQVGERVRVGDLDFEIAQMEGRRVKSVRLAGKRAGRSDGNGPS
jgi:magnesium and cobalt transporter